MGQIRVALLLRSILFIGFILFYKISFAQIPRPFIVLEYLGSMDKAVPSIVFYTSTEFDSVSRHNIVKVKVTKTEFAQLLVCINERYNPVVLKSEPIIDSYLKMQYETEEEEVTIFTCKAGMIFRVFKNISQAFKDSTSKDIVLRYLNKYCNLLGILQALD